MQVGDHNMDSAAKGVEIRAVLTTEPLMAVATVPGLWDVLFEPLRYVGVEIFVYQLSHEMTPVFRSLRDRTFPVRQAPKLAPQFIGKGLFPSAWHLGRRTKVHTMLFMQKLRNAVNPQHWFQLRRRLSALRECSEILFRQHRLCPIGQDLSRFI
jgi:hypothetical protein